MPSETFRCSFLPSRVAVQAYSPSSDFSKLRKIKSKPRPSLLCSTYTLKTKSYILMMHILIKFYNIYEHVKLILMQRFYLCPDADPITTHSGVGTLRNFFQLSSFARTLESLMPLASSE